MLSLVRNPPTAGMMKTEGQTPNDHSPLTAHHSLQTFHRPLLVPHARYRWDKLRGEHQLVFPEGMLVLNETGAAIVRLCDGRPFSELLAALGERFPEADFGEDVRAFLDRLLMKGLLREAADS